MKITADTNLLVRVIVRDEVSQAHSALRILAGSDAVVLPLPCLCEFVWVLTRTYSLSSAEVAAALRAITQRANVMTDTHAVDAGLRVLESGGDFADGVIAWMGASMGAEDFVSFDGKAVDRIKAIGLPATLATSDA